MIFGAIIGTIVMIVWLVDYYQTESAKKKDHEKYVEFEKKHGRWPKENKK